MFMLNKLLDSNHFRKNNNFLIDYFCYLYYILLFLWVLFLGFTYEFLTEEDEDVNLTCHHHNHQLSTNQHTSVCLPLFLYSKSYGN